MPLFSYKCPKCGKAFEELVKSHLAPAFCPVCGEKGERAWSGEMYSATGKQIKKCSGNCSACSGCK